MKLEVYTQSPVFVNRQLLGAAKKNISNHGASQYQSGLTTIPQVPQRKVEILPWGQVLIETQTPPSDIISRQDIGLTGKITDASKTWTLDNSTSFYSVDRSEARQEANQALALASIDGNPKRFS